MQERVSPLHSLVLAQPLIKLLNYSLLQEHDRFLRRAGALQGQDMFSADSHSDRFLLNSLSFLGKAYRLIMETAAELPSTT